MKKATNRVVSLQEMRLATGDAALIRKAYNEETWDEFEKCTFAFFPGCMLNDSEPELVIRTYDEIKALQPDTGIFLYCCGIPAKVAGDDDLFEKTLFEVKSAWEKLGKPTLIITCPGCYNTFKANLPEIPMVTVYKFLLDNGISADHRGGDYFIKEPAVAIDGDETSVIARDLAEKAGAILHAESEDGELPYIAFSIKDRENLKAQGKNASHILELFFADTSCNSCTSCGGCSKSCIPELPLTEEEKSENLKELKQAILEFFFYE